MYQTDIDELANTILEYLILTMEDHYLGANGPKGAELGDGNVVIDGRVDLKGLAEYILNIRSNWG